MKEIKITKNDAEQRLDKFLLKYLDQAPSSLIHKFLRRKDIRLNGKKAQGNEHLSEGDIVLIRLPDVQIAQLCTDRTQQAASYPHIHVLYEDEHVLILNKPAGILTQKARGTDVSLNEELTAYLMQKGDATPESLHRFRPAVCNRLDRNTAGIVLAAKTLPAAQEISSLLRSRQIEKFYQCIVIGTVKETRQIESWLIKDEKTNTVRVLKNPEKGAARIETHLRPLCLSDGYSRLEIHLVTGKTHQIRAQMSALGYPIAGDTKYGGRMKGVDHQALVSYKVVFPVCGGALSGVCERTFEAPLPADFRKLASRLNLD